MTTYSIADITAEFNLTVRTIRFWEERGLINPKRDSHSRVYSEKDRSVVAEIVNRRRQHFTIEEIKRALDAGGFTQKQILGQLDFLRGEHLQIGRAVVGLEDELSRQSSEPKLPRRAAH